jgi:hypothetical protein
MIEYFTLRNISGIASTPFEEGGLCNKTFISGVSRKSMTKYASPFNLRVVFLRHFELRLQIQ